MEEESWKEDLNDAARAAREDGMEHPQSLLEVGASVSEAPSDTDMDKPPSVFFEKAGADLNDATGLGEMQWLALDARLHPHLHAGFAFKYFPGVFYVSKSGKPVLYTGSRDGYSVLQWAKKMNRAENNIAASYLETAEEASKCIDEVQAIQGASKPHFPQEQIGCPHTPPPSSLLEEDETTQKSLVQDEEIQRYIAHMQKGDAALDDLMKSQEQ